MATTTDQEARIKARLAGLKDAPPTKHGAKRWKLVPYRELIFELRALDPATTWDKIQEILQDEGIAISRSTLARAFGAGGRGQRRGGLGPDRPNLSAVAGTGTSDTRDGEQQLLSKHGPKGLNF